LVLLPVFILIVIPSTTIPAMHSFNKMQDVSELHESTYIPEDEPVNTASSTHTQSAQPTKEVAYHPQRQYTAEQIAVAIEILKVFPDAPIMVEVAWCESHLTPTADRANLGVDVGVFQLNQVHLNRLAELGLDRWNLHDNIAFARMLYDESGLQPWYMSEYCWG
jgi:hypothetical protein